MVARTRASVRPRAVRATERGSFGRRLVPSGRSILIGLGLVAIAVSAYVLALQTSVFAVRKLEVKGGSPATQAAVRAALAPELGRSLLHVDGADVTRRLASVTTVLSVRVNRSFPHTLVVRIRPERPVLLLRQGSDGWVVAASGRVLAQVKSVRLSSLPRTYVAHTASISVGGTLAPNAGGVAAAALAPLVGTPLFGRVRFVTATPTQLTLDLRSGVQVRLGDPGDLRLKYAITRRILAILGPSTTRGYVDVSVPQRPVYGQQNPQVVSRG